MWLSGTPQSLGGRPILRHSAAAASASFWAPTQNDDDGLTFEQVVSAFWAGAGAANASGATSPSTAADGTNLRKELLTDPIARS